MVTQHTAIQSFDLRFKSMTFILMFFFFLLQKFLKFFVGKFFLFCFFVAFFFFFYNFFVVFYFVCISPRVFHLFAVINALNTITFFVYFTVILC